MAVWQNIYENFKEVLEELQDLNVQLVQSNVDLSTVPTTTVNGAYFLAFNGLNNYTISANKVLDLSMEVKLQLGYVLNENDYQVSYNSMMSDVETIIAARLNADDFGENILIDLQPIPPPKKVGAKSYLIWEMTFIITGRNILP